MANTDIKTGEGLDAGLIQLTLLSVGESRECGGERKALLTARGKDHDMNADQLEKLGKTCIAYAEKIRGNR